MKKLISDYIRSRKHPANFAQLFRHLQEQGYLTDGACCVVDCFNTPIIDNVSPPFARSMVSLINADCIQARRVKDATLICRGKKKYTCAADCTP